jgi:predicted ATP-grasp superfamily ATP-dependent carboligase
MNVIITCANSPIMNEVIALVGKIPDINEIVLVDSEEVAFSHGTKISALVPRGGEKDYNSTIYSLVEKHNIQFIFVCSDEEALSLSSEQWVKDISHLDSYENIELVLNKFRLHEKLSQANENVKLVPEFTKLTSFNQLNEAVQQFGSLILRPIHGRGSRGLAHIVSNELKKIYGLGITIQDYTMPKDPDNYFLTAYLPGDKFSADCIFQKGEILSCMIRNNGCTVKYKPPTMVAETSLDSEVYTFAQKIGECLKLDGFHQIECGKDANGKVKLIEINPRLDATLPITVCYPYNFYELILNKDRKGLLIPEKKIFQRFFISNTK